MVALAIGSAVYVFSSAAGNGPATGLQRHAKGALANLVVLEAPPARPRGAFVDVTGAERTLADFEGRYVLLNLWATWCAPCVKEMPTLDAVQAQFDPDELLVLPVSFDRTIEEASDFFAEFGIENLGVYNDRTLGLGKEVAAQGLPISVLYDPRGRELARISREVDWAAPEAIAFLETVVNDAGPAGAPAS